MKFSPFFKGHFAVVGNTGMGKGVVVSAVARMYRRRGLAVYLLTCKEDEYETFPADFKTMDEDRFLDAVMSFKGAVSRNGEQQAIGMMAVIDEAWNWTWKRKLEAVANAGRSRGIEMWAQGTRILQMPPSVRGNCENIICFRQKLAEDVERLVKDRGPEFGIADRLRPGQFVATIEDRTQYGTAWEPDENGKYKRGIEF